MHPATTIAPIIALGVVAIAIAVYAYFPRIKGLHYTSLLTCPKCGNRFEYNWVPGGSFTAIRWGKYRFMRCPRCGRASWFDIWSTRIDSQ